MRHLYSFLLYLFMPFIFLRLWLRSRNNPAYGKRWRERLGFTPHRLNNSIWVHAVSVGETIAAIPLIKNLKETYPDRPILVTNMTPTGAARVKAAFGEAVLQTYIPYDYPDALTRFLKRVNPCICIIMETELWPNLFAVCKKQQVPIVLTNARLSEKSAKGYAMIPFLTRPMLQAVHTLASQGYADAKRFIELGADKDKVVVTGNLKFDLVLPEDLLTKAAQLKNQLGSDRLIWVAASTHPGEEEIVLAAHKQIIRKFPNALLILVPRHPDRFDAVAELIKTQKLNYVRRSEKSENIATDINVYLADTMGEMLLMYAVCDVAFVAGSFATIGGHNMLEAAALEKPVITGPHLFNFAEISEKLLAAQGMISVQNDDELAANVVQFFGDANYRDQIGKNALQVVEDNRGSLGKQLGLIKAVIK